MTINITSIIYNDQEICSNPLNKSEEFTTITFEQNFNEITDGQTDDTNCQVDYETLEDTVESRYSTRPKAKKAPPLFTFFQWFKSSSTDSSFLKAAPERVTTRRPGLNRAPPKIPELGGFQPGIPAGALPGGLPGLSNSNKNQMVQITNIYVVNNSTDGQNITFESINNSNYIYKVLTQIFNAFVGTPNFRRNQSTKPPTATF